MANFEKVLSLDDMVRLCLDMVDMWEIYYLVPNKNKNNFAYAKITFIKCMDKNFENFIKDKKYAFLYNCVDWC